MENQEYAILPMIDLPEFDSMPLGALDDGEMFKPLDLCGLVLKVKSKSRHTLAIPMEAKQVAQLIKAPPKTDECYKFVSVCGGFSSIAFIEYVAQREIIEKLLVTTFRVAKKQIDTLHAKYKQGRLKSVTIITSTTQKEIRRENQYFNYVKDICEKCGWTIKAFDNHSKLILMQTAKNWYVMETSSNLNENPKMEQFSWENDMNLFNFYADIINELVKQGR